jgi:DNA-binding response OmpR family regulator
VNDSELARTTEATIVVCEDDCVTLELLCEHLASDRFKPVPAASATDALRLCGYLQPELLLLDLSLPDNSGLDLLKQIRESNGSDSRVDPNLPVVVLTSDASDGERARSLERGADDCLTKPFHYPQLRACLAALLRRRTGRGQRLIEMGELVVDPARRRVWVADRQVELSKKEFDLLRVLASDPIRVFAKRELLEEVWGYRTQARARTLEAHASRLRRKLDPENARFVINCWGVGYRLLDETGASA